MVGLVVHRDWESLQKNVLLKSRQRKEYNWKQTLGKYKSLQMK
jgi:hypothetical protein